MHPPTRRSRRRRLLWRLWRRSGSGNHHQALLAWGSLLVAATVTSMLLNLYGDVRRKMTEEFRSYGANVLIAPADAASAGTAGVASTMRETVFAPLERFAQQHEGLVSTPVLYGVVHVRRIPPDARLPRFETVVATGSNFASLRRMNSGWQVAASASRARHLPPGTCAVGAHLAERLKVGVGGRVDLRPVRQRPDAQTAPEKTFRVAVVLSTGASEDDQVFVPLLDLQNILGTPGKISLAELSVPGTTSQIEQAVHELSVLLPGAEVRPVRQIVYSEGKVLGTIRWLLLSLTSVILVIVGLCVMATVTAIMLERRRDIGVMKALGAGDSIIMRLFMAEGAGLGFAAGVAGYFLGGMLARGVGERLFGVPLNLAWWSFPVVCGSAILIVLFATLMPVRVVRAIEPAVVLKGE